MPLSITLKYEKIDAIVNYQIDKQIYIRVSTLNTKVSLVFLSSS